MKRLITLVLFSLTFNSYAEGVYRDDTEVIEPAKPQPVKDQITPVVKAFESKYQQAGKPKIALFWNVELIDSVEDQHIKVETISGDIKESSNSLEKSTSGKEGNATLKDGESQMGFNTRKTETTEHLTTDNKRSTTLSEKDMWKSETAFTSLMRKSGVRFIDRNAILRTTALKESTKNLPELETKAVLAKADLLMEVLIAKDPDAPLGWGFKVSVKNLNSGEEVTSLYTEAYPIQRTTTQTKFKASDKGFEKVTYTGKSTVKDIGEALAVDVMSELGQNLRR